MKASRFYKQPVDVLPTVYLPATGNRLHAPATGIFFVTVSRLVKFQNLNTSLAKVSMYVHLKKSRDKKDRLISSDYFDVNEMGPEGTITLQVGGFLKMNKGDEIIVGIDNTTAKAVELRTTGERFSCVSLESSSLPQYYFKTAEDSKVKFKSELAIENFNLFSLIYSSGNARFFGPSFIVDKPMLVLYDFSIELHEAIGIIIFYFFRFLFSYLFVCYFVCLGM